VSHTFLLGAAGLQEEKRSWSVRSSTGEGLKARATQRHGSDGFSAAQESGEVGM